MHRSVTCIYLGFAAHVFGSSLAGQITTSVPSAVALIAGAVLPTGPDYSARDFLVNSSTIHIEWDSYGTPKVSSNTDWGAFYGWGYAMSVDRFFQMEMARRDILGLQAELLGADPVEPGGRDPLDRDMEVRKLRLPFFLQKCLDRMTIDQPSHVTLLQGFSAGVNKYLTEILGPPTTWPFNSNFQTLLINVHPLFQNYPLTGTRLKLWTPLHCLASLWPVSDSGNVAPTDKVANTYSYRYLTTKDDFYAPYVPKPIWDRYWNWYPQGDQLSHEAAIEVMFGNSVFDEDAATVKYNDVLDQLPAINQYVVDYGWSNGINQGVSGLQENPDLPLPHFSHAFAVGGERTSNGRAVLLGMPQLPVIKLLFEISVKGASFTARGVSFPGCPGFMVGFNDDVAWSITSAGGTLDLVYELAKGSTNNQLDDTKYRFGGATYTITQTTEQIPTRSGSTWVNNSVTIKWADAVHQDDSDGLLDTQSIELGIPIVTDQLHLTARDHTPLLPLSTAQYGVLSHRYFHDQYHTINAYIGMLSATSVGEIDTALAEYANPACSMVAGDKDGDVGFWYLKKIPLHSPSIILAPLGVFGSMSLSSENNFCRDVIPNHILPHVINPQNQLFLGVRSPIEDIVLTGNSCVVGAWYPLPAYGGYGDTLRSMRFRQLLGASGNPDHVFTPEQLLAFHYDDVDPLTLNTVKVLQHQKDHSYAYTSLNFSGTDEFLTKLASTTPNWLLGGGHLHTAHPLTGGLVQVGASLRQNYRDLTRVVGQVENGKCLLVKKFDEILQQNPSADLFTELAAGDQDVYDDVLDYMALSLANGWTLAKTGFHADGGQQAVVPLHSDPDRWHLSYEDFIWGDQYSATIHYVGAKYRIVYHDDLLAYGGLDSTHDIVSGVLHNTVSGIGSQINNFYSQWVHFRWHDTFLPPGASPHAYSVYNTGNSLHPSSPYFHNNYLMWERNGKLFDLDQAQANPTMWLRQSPLQ